MLPGSRSCGNGGYNVKSVFWYLGFLSLLSLLFFAEGKIGFLGFLGFLSFFSVYKISDEMLEVNIGRASRNAFLYAMFFGSASLVYLYLTNGIQLLGAAFVVLFGGCLLVCLLSLFYYQKAGK